MAELEQEREKVETVEEMVRSLKEERDDAKANADLCRKVRETLWNVVHD